MDPFCYIAAYLSRARYHDFRCLVPLQRALVYGKGRRNCVVRLALLPTSGISYIHRYPDLDPPSFAIHGTRGSLLYVLIPLKTANISEIPTGLTYSVYP